MNLKRNGFTLIELLVTILVISLLVAILLPAAQQARESARKSACINNLHQIGIALHNYHSTHKKLPIGALIRGPAFEHLSGWGWGAMTLPFLESGNLHAKIDFNSPTAVDSNLELLKVRLPVFVCPSEPQTLSIEVAINGDPTFPAATGNVVTNSKIIGPLTNLNFSNITDGLSSTILGGEHRFIEPSEPDASDAETSHWCGIATNNSEHVFQLVPYIMISKDVGVNVSTGFGSSHYGGANFFLADGSARFVSENVDAKLYFALGTPSAGENAAF